MEQKKDAEDAIGEGSDTVTLGQIAEIVARH